MQPSFLLARNELTCTQAHIMRLHEIKRICKVTKYGFDNDFISEKLILGFVKLVILEKYCIKPNSH